MDNTSPIPFRAAQAYGVPAAPPAIEVPGPAATPTPARASGIVDRVELSSAPTTRLTALVAGTVRSDINRGYGFDGDPTPSTTSPTASGGPQGPARTTLGPTVDAGTFPLYTNRAEHVEAATRLEVGSTIDIRG